VRPHPAMALTLSTLLLLSGCSTLREIPRDELADQPEQKDVVVQMKNGERRAFDSARFGPDSLWGFNQSEESGDVPELTTTPMSLNDVTEVAIRHLDWYKTSLGVGAALGVALAVVLSARSQSQTGGDGTPVKPPPELAGHAAH
jgi:hypothetical protein